MNDFNQIDSSSFKAIRFYSYLTRISIRNLHLGEMCGLLSRFEPAAKTITGSPLLILCNQILCIQHIQIWRSRFTHPLSQHGCPDQINYGPVIWASLLLIKSLITFIFRKLFEKCIRWSYKKIYVNVPYFNNLDS